MARNGISKSALLDKLHERLQHYMGHGPTHFRIGKKRTQPSPANLRATARLAAVREKNRSIPMDEVESRQVRRAKERGAQKARLSDLKAWMRNNKMNGASLTRVPAEMEAFYGQ